MSAVTDTLHGFIRASNRFCQVDAMAALGKLPADSIVLEEAAQELSRAGDAYETALAQFTADVARHAVT